MNSTSKKTQDIAQKIAKQIAQEPLEILKTAGQQVSSVEIDSQNSQSPDVAGESAKSTDNQLAFKKDEEQSTRMYQTLEAEMKDIRTKKQQEELQKKQALEQQLKQENAGKKPLVEPMSKKGRRFIAGMAGKIEQLKKKSEIRMPPSG